MTQKSKSLIGGISILGLAGLICKVVGVLYRIPLAAYIGGEGIGIYSKVFPEIQNGLQNPSIQELSYQSTRARWMYLDFIRRHPGYSPTREF